MENLGSKGKSDELSSAYIERLETYCVKLKGKVRDGGEPLVKANLNCAGLITGQKSADGGGMKKGTLV